MFGFNTRPKVGVKYLHKIIKKGAKKKRSEESYRGRAGTGENVKMVYNDRRECSMTKPSTGSTPPPLPQKLRDLEGHSWTTFPPN